MGLLALKNKKQNKGEQFIQTYSRLNKWINECIYCHKRGYNTKLPEKIWEWGMSIEVHLIKKYFSQLDLNEFGMCRVCAKLFSKNKGNINGI